MATLPKDFYKAVVLAESWGIHDARTRLSHWEALAEAGRMVEAEYGREELVRETLTKRSTALFTIYRILCFKLGVSVLAGIGAYVYLALSS